MPSDLSVFASLAPVVSVDWYRLNNEPTDMLAFGSAFFANFPSDSRKTPRSAPSGSSSRPRLSSRRFSSNRARIPAASRSSSVLRGTLKFFAGEAELDSKQAAATFEPGHVDLQAILGGGSSDASPTRTPCCTQFAPSLAVGNETGSSGGFPKSLV